MKLGGKLLKTVFIGGLTFALTSVLAIPASAAVTSGTYIGTGTTQRVDTNLATIRVVRIYEIPTHGQGAFAYTSDAMQALGQGTFLNGTKRDTGITFNASNFVVNNPDFIQVGVVYAWDAGGD